MRKFVRALVVEGLRLALGAGVVIGCTIITLHMLGAKPSDQYTVQVGSYLVLYSLLWLCILAFQPWRRMEARHAVAAGFAVLGVCTTFLPFVPMGVDRSLTFFMLRDMAKTDAPRSMDSLEQALVAEFVCACGTIPKRVSEQMQSGTIAQDAEGKFVLTPAGHATVAVIDGFASMLQVPPPLTSETTSCRALRFIGGVR